MGGGAAGRRRPKWAGGRAQLSSGTLRAARVLRLYQAGRWEARGWEVWSEEVSVHTGIRGGEEHMRSGGSAHLHTNNLGTSAPHW